MESRNNTFALPQENIFDMLDSWSRICKYHECGSIYLAGDSMLTYRYHDLISTPELINKYFCRITPLLIDAVALSLEDPHDWERIFINENKSSIYFLYNIDRYLLENNAGFFQYLKDRHVSEPDSSYLLFFKTDFLHPQFSRVFSGSSIIIQNAVFHPLISDVAGVHFLHYLENKWNININPEIADIILKQCRRQMWLIKQAVRYVRDAGSVDPDEIFHNEMMEVRLKLVYDSLLPSEQSVLRKIYLGQNDFTADEYHSIDFFKKTGWLETVNQKLLISTPILEKYVANLARPQLNLRIFNQEIYLDQVRINDLFSGKESNLLKCLIVKPRAVVSRDEIARFVWGQSWESLYSDWALDQLISRVRHKLARLNIEKNVIRSEKGKGFVYDG